MHLTLRHVATEVVRVAFNSCENFLFELENFHSRESLPAGW
jgi:hypothetical protein